MRYFLSIALMTSASVGSPALGQEMDDIRGVKNLIEIPVPPNYGLWAGIALGALLLAALIWKLLSRKRPAPARSSAERALAELKDSENLIESESPEPLANAVTATVRRYIEERFGIAAPRRTTEEFFQDVSTHGYPGITPFAEDLSRFLRFCDELKFGRGSVDRERRVKLIESARRFVESTSRSETDVAQPKSIDPVAA